MSKKRIYQFAREQDMSSKELLEIAQDAGLDYSSHMATINDNEMAKLKEFMNNKTNKQTKDASNQSEKKQTEQSKSKNNKHKQQQSSDKKTNLNPEKRTTSEKQKAKERQNRSKKRHSRQHRGINGGPAGNRTKRKTNTDHKQQNQSSQPTKSKPLPEVVEYTEGMTVAELAKELYKPAAEIVKKLFMMGVVANKNQSLDSDSIEIILEEYGVQAQEKVEIDETDFDTYFEQEVNEENLTLRPPTVTIMGHVDHGKTTLLDTLRQEKVADGEAGGITQHIGAYQLEVEGKPITFLDTPGHAAFTTMRARGADVTDIAIIVVAADDGVMPQTVEAINHAKAAEVPIIVAVNKIDKPEANPQQVMQELSQYELIPEDWGGQTIFVEISAKFNQNLEELLEMILLVAEVEELKADPTRLAIGTVLEARLDKAQGPIATLLVQEGTLKHGDPIVVGTANGRIRTMTNDQGQRVKQAGPSMPVEITGLNDTPQAGDRFVVFDDEKKARSIGQSRAEAANEAQRNAVQKVTLENLFDSIEEGELKEITVIVKGDVQGSVEAIVASLEKIEVEGVKIKIVHTGVGAINESDVTLASASGSIIIGFNVRPTPQAQESANREQIDIRTHRVIYNAIDEIESAMKGMLDPEFEEKVTGQATVRETFNVSKVGTIAGCYVSDGVIKRSSSVRVIRQGVVKYEGELSSLKRFQDDAKEVSNGFECGLTIENFNDIKIDDVIEAYEMVEVKRN
ncbi:translation initiation factor IF-2 [Dolosigranulum savutiense]|uniref:Translation initiation factor IF-2 n=1 Tax=Dolosigranulum savutiense TaxID=3110288 RepID=A0AB74TSZ1_9LACT